MILELSSKRQAKLRMESSSYGKNLLIQFEFSRPNGKKPENAMDLPLPIRKTCGKSKRKEKCGY